MSFSVYSPTSFSSAAGPQGLGRLGDENLPAVRRRADPRRPDDVEPEVALVADRGLARVQHHRTFSSTPSGQSFVASARCAETAAATASRVLVNEKKKASPWRSISYPPAPVQLSRMIRRCSASTAA